MEGLLSMRDVVVVGGGPSGLFAAKKLAEYGLDVLLLERKAEIGQNIVCTGIIGHRAFKEFGLSRQSILRDLQKVTVFSPRGDRLDYQHPTPFASVVDRERFDLSIRDQAVRSGVEIKTDLEVVDVAVGSRSAEVFALNNRVFKERFLARAVVIATGINYRLHKKLKLGYPRHFVNGIQTELNLGAVDGAKIFIGKSVAPGAFAWAVPIGSDRARIGLMTEKSPETYFERLLNRIDPERAAALDMSRIQTKVIAQGVVSGTFGERVMAIGEAAGQNKTTTGGGVYFGLLCSSLAAETLSRRFREGRFSAPDLAEYERSWKKVIQKEIQVGLSLRKLLAKLNDTFVESVFRLAKHDGIIPLIREQGDFDWHGDLLMTILKRIPYFWSPDCQEDSGSLLRMN